MNNCIHIHCIFSKFCFPYVLQNFLWCSYFQWISSVWMLTLGATSSQFWGVESAQCYLVLFNFDGFHSLNPCYEGDQGIIVRMVLRPIWKSANLVAAFTRTCNCLCLFQLKEKSVAWNPTLGNFVMTTIDETAGRTKWNGWIGFFYHKVCASAATEVRVAIANFCFLSHFMLRLLCYLLC